MARTRSAVAPIGRRRRGRRRVDPRRRSPDSARARTRDIRARAWRMPPIVRRPARWPSCRSESALEMVARAPPVAPLEGPPAPRRLTPGPSSTRRARRSHCGRLRGRTRPNRFSCCQSGPAKTEAGLQVVVAGRLARVHLCLASNRRTNSCHAHVGRGLRPGGVVHRSTALRGDGGSRVGYSSNGGSHSVQSRPRNT